MQSLEPINKPARTAGQLPLALTITLKLALTLNLALGIEPAFMLQ